MAISGYFLSSHGIWCHHIGGKNPTRGNPRSIVETNEQKVRKKVLRYRAGGGSRADFRELMKSLSEKITFKLRPVRAQREGSRGERLGLDHG